MNTTTTPTNPLRRAYPPFLFILLTCMASLILAANLPNNPAHTGLLSGASLSETGSTINRAGYDFPQEAQNTGDSTASQLPTLDQFINEIGDGSSSQIRGVYVPNVLALKVGQQPSNQGAYVTGQPGQVTQFRLAEQRGVTGFLAHNYLSGEEFYDLWPGMPVYLIYGDGYMQKYIVVSRSPFQKLSPGHPRSNYIDISTGEVRTTLQVFNQFYTGDHHLTFQTCLEAEGLSNWGLFFVVAVPVDDIGMSSTSFPRLALKPY